MIPHVRDEATRRPSPRSLVRPRHLAIAASLGALVLLATAGCQSGGAPGERTGEQSAASNQGVWCRGIQSESVIDHPHIVNVYWDTSAAQWDADVAKANWSVTPTHELIDAYTRATTYSTYYSDLAQYGVNAFTFDKSIFMGDVCGATIGAPPADTGVGHGIIGNGLPCLSSQMPSYTGELIVNILYPPQVKMGSDIDASADGYHDQTGGWSATAWEPLSAQNSMTVAQLTETMTHEMVESATDPSGIWGYRSTWVIDGQFAEIADLCQAAPYGQLPADDAPGFLSPTLGATVAGYFSNNYGENDGCVTGTENDAPPIVFAVPHGRGENMTFDVTVVSPTDDMVPPDLQNLGTSANTIYLSGALQSGSHPAVHVGRKLMGDSLLFRQIAYQNGPGCTVPFTPGTDCNAAITIDGFNQDVTVNEGDAITLFVSDPLSGFSTSTIVTAPPNGAVFLGVYPPEATPESWTTFGDASYVYGHVSGSCQNDPATAPSDPIEGQGVLAHTTSNHGDTISFTGVSDPWGAVQFPYWSETAGVQQLVVDSPTWPAQTCGTVHSPASPFVTRVQVHPLATSLSPDNSLAIHPVVTLYGAGFTPNNPSRTTVTVAGVAATNLQVASGSITFTAPEGAAGRTVQVIAYVDGVPSLPLEFSYDEPPPPPTCDGEKKPTTLCPAPETWICCSTWVCAKYCAE
jgi:hypothetical protein